jgi:hypothetical protein
VHRIHVQERRRPRRDLIGHVGQFLVAEAEGDPRLVHEATVAEGALLEAQPTVVAADAAAPRRREDGPPQAGLVAEQGGQERIPEQSAKFLFGPP